VLPISDIPVCLREFASQFGKLFKHPAQRQHFEEVLAGLIVSENRTVAGIQQRLLSDTEYDSLQHFMTDTVVDFEVILKKTPLGTTMPFFTLCNYAWRLEDAWCSPA
jgi:hypothetical protein